MVLLYCAPINIKNILFIVVNLIYLHVWFVCFDLVYPSIFSHMRWQERINELS